jgi:hypothetical protein
MAWANGRRSWGISLSGDRRPVRYLLGLVGYTAVLLVGLLAPFRGYPTTTNDVRWAPAAEGLQFVSTGVARSAGRPVKLHDRLVGAGRMSIAVWVSSADTRQRGPARIVSYSNGTAARNFTVGQEGADLVVRLRTTRTNDNGSIPQVVLGDVFAGSDFRHIVVTYDGVHESIYVDGAPRLSTDRVQGALVNWDARHWLIAGNEHTATRPWRGVIRLVAIYDRVLAPAEVRALHASTMRGDGAPAMGGPVALYRFTKAGKRVADTSGVHPAVDLDIPDTVEPVPVLLDVQAPTSGDLVLNLVLFVPLGALAALALIHAGATRVNAIALTLALAAALSLTVEVLQYFVVSRSSEVSDVLLNTLGAGVAAWITVACRRRLVA